MAPMWKELMKNVDLDQSTSFLDLLHLGCTQRECKPNESIIDQFTAMFESRICATATENYQDAKKTHAKAVAWSYDMEGPAKKCVDFHCELANEKTEQLYTVSTPFLDVTTSRRSWKQ